jgi:hypothetical protein
VRRASAFCCDPGVSLIVFMPMFILTLWGSGYFIASASDGKEKGVMLSPEKCVV